MKSQQETQAYCGLVGDYKGLSLAFFKCINDIKWEMAIK
jgi:hypothetical protein